MKTTVVNLRKENYDIYIGRGSIFGNPFVIGKDGTREEVIKKYKEWFYEKVKNLVFRKKVYNLIGKRLGCFCKPQACHGDVIIEFLEGVKNENIINF